MYSAMFKSLCVANDQQLYSESGGVGIEYVGTRRRLRGSLHNMVHDQGFTP